jgi:hypothetical protein
LDVDVHGNNHKFEATHDHLNEFTTRHNPFRPSLAIIVHAIAEKTLHFLQDAADDFRTGTKYSK